jgi:hypothetical protein
MKPITLGCERGDQIQKYGSYDACMKEREKEKAIQDMLARRNDYPIIGGSDTEKKVFEMQRAERQLQDEEAKTPYDSAYVFAKWFERPSSINPKRMSKAEEIYKQI